MGSSASSHGGRRVSFGLDERDQVRVLQGIRVRRPGGVVGPGVGGCEGRGRRELDWGRVWPGGQGNEVQGWKGRVGEARMGGKLGKLKE